MKKLFLICLMMLAGSAWAEWVRFGYNDTFTYYYDPAKIRKDGNMRRVWELHDLTQRNNIGEISRRMLVEFDCKQERARFLSASSHSERMAVGKVLRTEEGASDWHEIPPDTIDETLFNIVCAN